MAYWNFYDVGGPTKESADEFKHLIEYDYKFGKFSVYQVFEATFRALMSSGVSKETKAKGSVLTFGGYSYQTFPSGFGSSLDSLLRETSKPLENVNYVHELCNRFYQTHNIEFGQGRIAIVKLGNLNAAMADYNNFLKSLDLKTFASGNTTIEPSMKQYIIEQFQKAIAQGLEVADRSPDEMISFAKDGTNKMSIQPHLYTYFNDYIVGSYIYWGYILKQLFADKKGKVNPNTPINAFIRDKIKYDHLGNKSEDIRFNSEFFDKFFNIDRIRKRIEGSKDSTLFATREEYFLNGPSLGKQFIDAVIEHSGIRKPDWKESKEWIEALKPPRPVLKNTHEKQTSEEFEAFQPPIPDTKKKNSAG